MDAALNGFRIIDLGRVWSGPLTTRILADFGAEVIKVESTAGRGVYTGPGARQNTLTEDFPDRQPGVHPWNRIGMFNDLNRNKQSLTLDLSTPEGAEIFKQLVRVCDVVVDNYTPRVMANFGLDYPALRQVKPEIIMLSMPAFGMTGPYHDFPGYGNTIEPVAGLTDLTGYPGEPPQPLGMIAGDVLAALHGVAAIMTAIQYRKSTGKGQYIDLSQAETQTGIIGEKILGYQLNGKIPERMGNLHPQQEPHGCYRCRGIDAWVVISVASDEEWRTLCSVMEQPQLADDGKFADAMGRRQYRDELDAIITEWTLPLGHLEITQRLQAYGIACGPVYNGRELLADPHLHDRGFIVEINHSEAGRHPYAGIPVRLSKMPAVIMHPAPLLGEHNRQVLGGLLGISDAKISQLEENKIIGDKPPDVV